MDDYFHKSDRLTFQHQTLGAVRELDFRLNEFVEASRACIEAFHTAFRDKTSGDDPAPGRLLRHRFSSLIGLIQTLKDVASKSIAYFSWDELSDTVSHAKVMQDLRNAAIHDAHPIAQLYADGRCYVAVNTRRKGQGKRQIEILAPEVDIETLALAFFASLSTNLAQLIRDLPEIEKLNGPPLPYEWHEAAIRHPALSRFNLELPPRQLPDGLASEPAPLDSAAALLDAISIRCQTRLKEISNLPEVPFP